MQGSAWVSKIGRCDLFPASNSFWCMVKEMACLDLAGSAWSWWVVAWLVTRLVVAPRWWCGLAFWWLVKLVFARWWIVLGCSLVVGRACVAGFWWMVKKVVRLDLAPWCAWSWRVIAWFFVGLCRACLVAWLFAWNLLSSLLLFWLHILSCKLRPLPCGRVWGQSRFWSVASFECLSGEWSS